MTANAPDIEALARQIAADEVVILPTDTLYGLHCSATSDAAVEKIFAIKERDRGKPLLVLASDYAQLEELGVIASPVTAAGLRAIWPAPLTAVLPLRAPVAASAGALTLAARVPALEWLRRLVAISGPITSTSVNVSGGPPLFSVDALPATVKNRVAAVVDQGPLRGAPSTLVDFTKDPPVVLREGAFRFTQNLWKSLRKSL